MAKMDPEVEGLFVVVLTFFILPLFIGSFLLLGPMTKTNQQFDIKHGIQATPQFECVKNCPGKPETYEYGN